MTEPRRINADALVAAHREQIGPGPEVEFGGQVFHLAPELPIDVSLALDEAGEIKEQLDAMDEAGTDPKDPERLKLQRLANRRSIDGLRGICGAELFKQMSTSGLSLDEMNEIIEAVITEGYGEDQGESEASAESSETTGDQPRLISSATTDSI